MKSLNLALVFGMITAAAAGASEPPRSTYSDPVYGFSLDVPELGSSEGALVVQRVVFAASPRNGFAVNCNVQVQFLEMKLPAYVDMSVRQLDAAVPGVNYFCARIASPPHVTEELMSSSP